MLAEMTSLELSEWYAYYNVQNRYREQATQNAESAAAAKRKAKDNNF